MFTRLVAAGAATLILTSAGIPAHAAPAETVAPAVTSSSRLTVRSANIQPDMVRTTINGQTTEKLVSIDSGYAKGVYCKLVDDGFNAVTLTWAIEQTSKTSGKLIPRTVGPGRAPTPTDMQIRTAVRNAKGCGISRVVFKEHIWLPDNEWRAHIPGTKKNQAAWTIRLLQLQKIALQEGVYEIVIGTEQRDSTTTSGDTARWVGTVKALRKADPKHKVRLTYAAHTNDELLKLGTSFVKSLDGLLATYYPRPQDGQHLSTADLQADMAKDTARYFDPAHKRYGNRFDGFAESGFRAVDWRDYYDPQGAADRVDQGLQARQYAAFLAYVGTLKYVDTLMLYRVQAGTVDPASFSWQNKQAEIVIRNSFR
jgi:hypothetical protein